MKTFRYVGLILCLVLYNCNSKNQNNINTESEKSNQYITVLGIAQDAGFPQINCSKSCCQSYYDGIESKKMISCLGLIDLESNEKWLFDATPDIVEQTQILKEHHLDNHNIIDGIFLTHAHIGHYTGLMFLGLEAMNASKIPVYTMPRMKNYLEENGPWSQLIQNNNIELVRITNDSTVYINQNISVTPIKVPHRDEYSETVGYKIEGKSKSALFIPDIDKWQVWNRNIIEEVKKVDYAFVDASFFKNGELERDMSKIPHPFTTETTTLFQNESLETKNKIHFIHFNHTNPTIKENHPFKDSIQKLGFRFAKEGMNFSLD